MARLVFLVAFEEAEIPELHKPVFVEGLDHLPLSRVAVREGLRAAVVVVVGDAVVL